MKEKTKARICQAIITALFAICEISGSIICFTMSSDTGEIALPVRLFLWGIGTIGCFVMWLFVVEDLD